MNICPRTTFFCFFLLLSLGYSPSALSLSDEAYSESLFYEDSKKNISNGQYIGGGVASLFPGLGIGHAIQGRYMERGWIFTAGQLVTFGGFIHFALISAFGNRAAFNTKRRIYIERISDYDELVFVFLAGYMGFKIWEAIDVWMLPSHYKIVKESPFQISPLAFYNEDKLDLGLSLKYKF